MMKRNNLKLKLSDFQKQIDDLKGKWKRALADYQNLERRVNQEKKSLVEFSNAVLIDKLLPVLDSLEKAQNHLKDKGLAMTVDQFKAVLKTEGVEEIQALNKKFNPLQMDCSEVVRGKEDVVVEVVEKGYFLKDKVLRPAKVKVGKGRNKELKEN